MYSYINENKPREIEVNITLTLTKSIMVKVDDYEIIDSGVDEDGLSFEDVDYSVCDLDDAVENQIILPDKAWKYINAEINPQIIEDLKGWEIEDMMVESNE